MTLGVVASHEDAGIMIDHGLECGLTLALLLQGQRQIEDTCEAHLGERVRWQPATPKLPRVDLAKLGRPLEHLVAFVGLLVAARLHAVGYMLLVVSVYQVALLALWIPRFVRAIRRVSRAAEGGPDDASSSRIVP